MAGPEADHLAIEPIDLAVSLCYHWIGSAVVELDAKAALLVASS